MTNGEKNGNDSARVTTREFYDALLAQNAERAAMERRINEKIDAGYNRIIESIADFKQSVTTQFGAVDTRLERCEIRNAAISERQTGIDTDYKEIREEHGKIKDDVAKLARSDKIWGGISAFASAVYATIVMLFGNNN